MSIASNGDTVVGVEFDLSWTDPALDVSALLGDAAASAGKSLSVVPTNAQTLHCLVVGLNQNGISDGVLVRFFVSVQPSAATGDYVLNFANVIAAGPDGSPVPLDAGQMLIHVQPSGGGISAAQVVNSASLASGPVAPTEIISLFGPGLAVGNPPFNPQEVSLNINGMPAPILYVGSKQINAVVPLGVDPNAPVALDLSGRGQRIGSVILPGAAAQPAIFTLDSSGTGAGAVLNEDYSVNSPARPARPGSIIAVYGTGFGRTDPPGTDGAPASIAVLQLPITATIGGINADVLYAGSAPTLINGADQINLRIPPDVPPGLVVPLVISIGSNTTQASVSISIR